MNAADLLDLQGRECVLLESRRATVVMAHGFRDDAASVYADLQVSAASAFEHSSDGGPFITRWDDISQRVGDIFTIFQPKAQVWRSGAYLHFSSPFGGTRLLFLDEYVEKMRQQDSSGWEWDFLMAKAGVEPRAKRMPAGS